MAGPKDETKPLPGDEVETRETRRDRDADGLPKVATGLWTELGPGDVLGTYRIVEKLPEGGMALLYAGRHLRLRRDVALKVLKPHYAARAKEARRFLEEARAISELNHPGIVEVFDFVEDAGRDPPLIYMVMELLRGETLGERLARVKVLQPAELIAIGRQVADALETVHRAGLLHRDLKSTNIFLLAGKGPPRVKLLDFGLTLPFGEREKLNLTDPGTTIGTPEYMSPEQILGRDMDPRSDVYMLGVVLYEMLTGSRPFTSDRVGDLLVRHVREVPKAPGRIRPGVPESLEAVVLRCLEKEPERRFASAGAVREALDLCPDLTQGVTVPVALLREGTDGAGTQGREHEGRRWGRTVLISLVLLLSGIGIFLGLAFVGGDPADKPVPAAGPTPDIRDALVPDLPQAPPVPDANIAPDAEIALDAGFDVPRTPHRAPRKRPPRKVRNKGLKSKPVAPTIDPWTLKP